jgi:hypothetical protein
MCATAVEKRRESAWVGHQKVPLRSFIADYKTFFFETNQKKEAHYLASVLNSPVIDNLLKPMQSRGLWGPRDICKKVLELPIPEFDQKDEAHIRLAEIAEACAQKVKEMVPDLKKLFKDVRGPHAIGRARTAVREALKDELAKIDAVVKEILN